MTARIPLWPGAKVTVTEHGVSWPAHVLSVKSAGVLVAWLTSDGKDRAGLDYFDADQVAPDFTDPDTFRGAVARLAERLGSSPERIAEGVTFFLDLWGGWTMGVGMFDNPDRGALVPWDLYYLETTTTDRAVALAEWWDRAPVPLDRMGTKAGLRAAWAQVLAEVKPCP